MRIIDKIRSERKNKKDPLYSMKFGNNHNVEEFLHGYCNLFLVYFLENTRGWTGKIMVRPSNNMIIHAYATRINEDGEVIYADARGVTNDEKEFFKPYWFRSKDVKIHDITQEEIEKSFIRIKEEGLEKAISELFEYVYC